MSHTAPAALPLRVTPTWAVVPRSALSDDEVAALLAIHAGLYADVDPARFRADLAAKDDVVLLRRPDGSVCGYSSLAVERTAAGPWVLCSGDTGVARDAWGSPALSLGWLAAAMAWRDRCEALDWLLLAGGPRTYRFLPLFFAEHWPRPGRRTPADVQARIDALAQARWAGRYRAGVVRLGEAPLRPELEPDRARPEDAFFRAANPGWRGGDELVCLAAVEAANLTPAGRRILRGIGR